MKRVGEILVVTWFGHNLELPLPAPQFDMYTVRKLIMQLDVEAPRQSIGGIMTRAQQRQAEARRRQAQEAEADASWAPHTATPSDSELSRLQCYTQPEPWYNTSEGGSRNQ